jgi:hypothetical protein
MSFSKSVLLDLNVPADLADRAIDKDWKGTPAHLGPHRYTPLRQAIEFKTSAALLALMAGSMFWAYERLHKHTDAGIVLSLSEAIFCYQVDPLYLNPIEKYRFIPRTDGVQLPEGAATVYPWIFFEKFFTFPRFWPIYPTIIETARTIYLTQHVMPKRDKRYEKWVEAVVKKLNLIAPLPDPRKDLIPPGSPLDVFEAESKRVIGQPLSPWALNVNEAFDPGRNGDEIDKLLQAADPTKNPFLRSLEDLKTAGFAGTPYRYPQ